MLLMVAACGDASPESYPRLHIPTPSAELGEVPVSEEAIEVLFQLENRGDAPLEVYRAESAGCLCVDARTVDARVAPGKSGRVIVRVRPAVPGERSTRATVSTNDPTQGVAELRVNWHAVQGYEWQPLQLDFGKVRPDQATTREVQLIPHVSAFPAMREGTAAAPMTEVVSGDARLSVHVDTTSDHLGGACVVSVTLDPGREQGPARGWIRVPDPMDRSKSCSLPVRWEVDDAVRAVPPRLFFGCAPGDAMVEREIVVVADLDNPFTVVKATVVPADADISFTQQGMSDQALRGKVAWKLPRREGIYRASLQLTCGRPRGCRVEIPMSVAVIATPPSGK